MTKIYKKPRANIIVHCERLKVSPGKTGNEVRKSALATPAQQ